jgi:hypothetical protein
MMAESTRSSGKKRERETLHLKGGARNIFPFVLKVPRRCPLFLLVGVCLRESKVSGSEKIKKPEGKKLSFGFAAYNRN